MPIPLHLMTGNLSHQTEHHLYPDLPSNRYAEIAPKVRDLMERYELRYVTGPLHQHTRGQDRGRLRSQPPPDCCVGSQAGPPDQVRAPTSCRGLSAVSAASRG